MSATIEINTIHNKEVVLLCVSFILFFNHYSVFHTFHAPLKILRIYLAFRFNYVTSAKW